MIIFSQIFMVVVLVIGVIRLVLNEMHVKLLKLRVTALIKDNAELTTKNAELLDLLTMDDMDRLGDPPAGKRIIHG